MNATHPTQVSRRRDRGQVVRAGLRTVVLGGGVVRVLHVLGGTVWRPWSAVPDVGVVDSGPRDLDASAQSPVARRYGGAGWGLAHM
jgi:hypothetical protein